MGQAEKKTQGDTARLGMLSIPNMMLEATGIPPNSDLIVEILPGVSLVDVEQPLWQTNRPYLKLFDDPGIKPEEAITILEKGGYLDE